jgi:hypothetical protein
MKKIKLYKFDTVIYPFDIWVLINKTPNIISDHFQEYNGDEMVFTDDDGYNRMDAFSMKIVSKENPPTYGAVLYFRNRKSMTSGLIVHEASHASKFLFEHISADSREHEPFEYMLEFVVNCCYKVKKKK